MLDARVVAVCVGLREVSLRKLGVGSSMKWLDGTSLAWWRHVLRSRKLIGCTEKVAILVKEGSAPVLSLMLVPSRLLGPRDAGNVPVGRPVVEARGHGALNCESEPFCGRSYDSLRCWNWNRVA